MDPSRRDFVQHLAAGTVGLSTLRGFEPPPSADLAAAALQDTTTFDLSWTSRVKGRHKAVFDCTEPEGGGALRMAIWRSQVADVMKAAPADISGVIIFRFKAIALAMQQGFWDKYGLARSANAVHPLTGEPTDRNPVLLDERDGIPFDASVPKQLAQGVTVLACNLAFRTMVETVRKADAVDAAEARRRALAGLVPGIILQPSGVFAAVLAQESGCAYLRS